MIEKLQTRLWKLGREGSLYGEIRNDFSEEIMNFSRPPREVIE